MEYSIDDLKTSALEKSSSPIKVEKVVVYILESEKKMDSDHTMSTDDIKKAYKQLKKDNEDIIDIPENTIATTISVLSNKADSRIQCLGRRQGYFVTPLTENPGEIEEDTKQTGKGKLLEKDLYPALKEWMKLSLDVQGIDISSRRGSEKLNKSA